MTLAACDAETQAREVDTVLRNGFVYTVNDEQPEAQAVAVDDGKIAFVGSDGGVREYVGPDTRVVDLQGRMVMPGLVDSHVHPVDGGLELSQCSLEYQGLTEEQFRSRIAECLRQTQDQEPDAWLEVVAWPESETQPPGTTLTKAALDGLKTQRPIIVYGTDGHKALVNSRALELSDIDASTPDPPDGSIVRDESGGPTGMLNDDAIGLVTKLVPSDTHADRVRYAQRAVDTLNEHGVTTVFDAGSGVNELRAYSELQSNGRLTLRTRAAAVFGGEDAEHIDWSIEQLQRRSDEYGEERLAVGAVKIFVDGVLEHPAKTAALLEPYLENVGDEKNPEWEPGEDRGPLYVPPDDLRRMVTALDRAGWQVHFHAIGDRAVREALNAVEAARHANGAEGWGNRHTITHLELVHPGDVQRFAGLRVVANMQMQWFQRDGYTVENSKPYIGEDRFDRLYPAGSLVESDTRLAASSDWPVDPLFPFYAIERGVTRTAEGWYGYPGKPLNAGQSLSVQTALEAYTLNGAFQLSLADEVGSLEAGKLADLIVLDQNLLEVPADRIDQTKVLMTMVDGEVVHEAKDWP